ncbi:MAG: dethiobiotin synthase [Planctomycetes bacterium]|nr:dethiobiotin synthase [Planctomycetota bacterium]
MNRALFITATDTGVGKTFLTSALASLLISKGIKVSVIKPISTGTENTDMSVYSKIRGVNLYNFYDLPLPLSPYQASLNLKRRLNFRMIISKTKEIINRSEVTLIEGIGGVAVPIDSQKKVYMIPAVLDLKTLLVATPWLGTINHTLLSVDCLSDNGVKLHGILLNANKNQVVDKYHLQLKGLVEALTSVSVYGLIRYKDPSIYKILAPLLRSLQLL